MRIFIANIFPKSKILKYGASVAAHNFCYNLIEGGTFDKIFSILPIGKVAKKDLSYEYPEIEAVCCSFLRKGKIALRLAPLLENIRLFMMIPPKASVWFYNLPPLSALLFILLKCFKPSVKLYIIILDFTPGKKGLRGGCESLLLRLINSSDGTIRLANSPLFTVKNSVCLPGIVPVNTISYPKVAEIKKEFLISGALGENISMLSMLLKSFSEMPELTLHITGEAPNIDFVKSYTNKYRNIIYHGMVSYDEYMKIIHKVPYLLSTRNPYLPENQCNFPSKIIEALLHNRIIVSTIHYEQLDGIRYFVVSASKANFINALYQITALPEEELLKYANQSEEIYRRYNSNVWIANMKKIEFNK